MSSTEVVTSIGNSWIICHSKTYSGRIYYFNTLTGEAVWNLSSCEVEKAKKRTSVLESESNFPIDNCPEPMHSPTDDSSTGPVCSKKIITTLKVTPSKVYNKQIINNQFSKIPFHYTAQLQPQYNSVNPIGINLPLNQTINQGMWNITPQPIFVTPGIINPVSPIRQTIYDNVPVTNTSVPLSCHFKSPGESFPETATLPKRRGFHFKHKTENSYSQRNRDFRNNSLIDNKTMDLRLILSTKKRKLSRTEGEEDFSVDNIDKNMNSNLENHNEEMKNYSPCIDDDDDDDDIFLEKKSKTSKKPLDVTPLKKLLQIKDDFQVWYIVIDSNIILNYINFINMLLNSDNQCHLMVPQIVMDKIQNATNTRLRTQAHRAAYFISQKLDANVAVIGNENSGEISDFKGQIINSCIQLVDQGYHAILITDDIELHYGESTIEFPVFTIREIKRILNNKTPAPFFIKCSSDKGLISESRNIKITIPNRTNETVELKHDNKTETALAENCSDTNIYNDNLQKDRAGHLLVKNCVQTDVIPKNTGDVGIQAELDTLTENNERMQNISISNTDMNSNKSKSVHLNRSYTYNNHLKFGNEKKRNYNKWHRRKTKSSLSIYSKSSTTSNAERTVDNITKDSFPVYAKSAYNLSYQVPTEFINNPKTYNRREDSSDSSSVRQSSFGKNVTFDDRSTAEPSNISVRSVECENSRSNLTTDRSDTDKSNSEKNVMFEVTCKAMEDCLRMKCDEWISRFVQIMEEAMSQILQQDPPFIVDTMLPPWTIYEATECIKRKFHYDYDTVDAATKLSNVLFEIGGLRGKIKIDISPNKYMEVYSYGVYLIDALQGLLSNSEDLQTAAESLSKLLSDIQDSHLNSSIQDSFNDVASENIVNLDTHDNTCTENLESIAEKEDNVDHSDKTELDSQKIRSQHSSPTQVASCQSATSKLWKYNLRSTWQTLLKQKEPISRDVIFKGNFDSKSSFFKSLDLMKQTDTNEDTLPTKVAVERSQSDNDIETDDVENNNTEDENSTVGANVKDNIETEQTKSNEPKVVRNFIACPEFEEKLKLKYHLVDETTYDSWAHKNDFDENNYGPDYETMSEQYHCDTDLNSYDDSNEMCDNKEMYDESYNDIPKNNINFKHIVGKIEHNVKEAFSSVFQFCEQSHSKLSSESSTLEKDEIQQLAEKTYIYVNNLCDAFNSILTRETSKMQELFSTEEFQDIILNDGDLESYRNFITKCAEQGNILKDSILLVIEAIKQ